MNNWLKKLYFCKFRNIGGKYHLWVVAGTMLIAMGLLAIVAIRYDSPPEFVFFPVVTLIIYAYLRTMWSYQQTNMMLTPNGDGRRSIHMAPLVSFFPCFYARQSSGFILDGTLAILKAGKSHGLTGSVILQSHLLGNERMRSKIAQQLALELPWCKITPLAQTTKLGRFNAWTLSQTRNARLKQSVSGKKREFSKDRPVGMIAIEN